LKGRARFASCCLCASLILAAPTQGGELRLVFDRREVSVTRDEKSRNFTASTPKTARIAAGMGDRYVRDSSPSRQTQVDFERRELRYVNDSEREITTIPLCAIIDRRESESGALLEMSAMLKNVVKREPMRGTLLDLEAEFGLRTGKHAEKGEELTLEGTPAVLICRFGLDTAAVCEFGDDTLSAKESQMFEKYLTYFAKLHPDAGHALAARRRTPRRLWYRWRSLGVLTTVELELREISRAADATLSVPAGYRQVAPDSALTAMLSLVRDSASSCRAQWPEMDHLVRDLEAAVAQGRALDALLTASEYDLTRCEPFPHDDPATRDRVAAVWERIHEDALAKAFHEAQNQVSNGDARVGGEMLDRLDRVRLQKAYLIDIERAKAFIRSGEGLRAREILERVLVAHPCLIGTWADLASDFMGSHDLRDAWICVAWARRFTPAGCGMLRRFDDRERELVATYPEYF
jgi:hypothetical protein